MKVSHRRCPCSLQPTSCCLNPKTDCCPGIDRTSTSAPVRHSRLFIQPASESQFGSDPDVPESGTVVSVFSERQTQSVHVSAPQILTRRLRFRLERAPGETALIDRTGRMLKMEPLATVESLEQYLLKMVRKRHGTAPTGRSQARV